MERLKQPRRSPASESAPHWRTIAHGTYVSTTLEIIYNMEICNQKFILSMIKPEKKISISTYLLITRTYTLKKSGEAGVIYSILERDIYGIILAFPFSYFLQYKTVAINITHNSTTYHPCVPKVLC